MRTLLGHPVLRMLAVCLCLMNITLVGAFAILVLYARERLGLTEVGFGLLLAASAVGGIAGTVVAARLQRRFGTSSLLRVGLVIETCTHLSLALARVPWVAVTTMVVFGAHASLWGILSLSWRQRVVPDAQRGRVNSGYFLFSVGGAAHGEQEVAWASRRRSGSRSAGWSRSQPWPGAASARRCWTRPSTLAAPAELRLVAHVCCTWHKPIRTPRTPPYSSTRPPRSSRRHDGVRRPSIGAWRGSQQGFAPVAPIPTRPPHKPRPPRARSAGA
jgi:hypothetical protein